MSKKKKEFIRMSKFLIFSISAGVIEAAVFALLNELTNLPYWPCYLSALVLSVVWNFTLNRQFTFKAANNIPVAMAKVAVFYVIFTPITTVGGNYLVETMGWNEYLVTAMNMVLNFATEYVYDRFFVFGKMIDTKVKDNENI
ncbi:GtrA family protein [Eubacterium sp.]|uniref:GtrA family protein n=1 Tax=Eubacterium sp. TaxID=142586 RepID=UPI002673B258|nr:GtrA family protein [uncultured Eubacterium sp.]